MAGLIAGKTLGLLLGSLLALRLTPAELPDGIGVRSLGALGLVAGIGFTVALFISSLALPEALAEGAKVAILVASIFASLLAIAAFRLQRSRSG